MAHDDLATSASGAAIGHRRTVTLHTAGALPLKSRAIAPNLPSGPVAPGDRLPEDLVIVAPLPPDEQDRLASLARYEILDTAPEQGFDDLTALASHICECPVALVTLVDAQRQRFKSHHGIDATEPPRAFSFCGHTILSTAPLVVPDTAHDLRFFDNSLCTDGPRVRFYAGASLITPDGVWAAQIVAGG